MSLIDEGRAAPPSDAVCAIGDAHRRFDDAYPELYAAAYETVYRYSSNRTQAADLAQEAMVRAFTHWRTLQDDPYRVAWVRRTAINLAIGAWRRRQTAERFRHLTLTRATHDDHQAHTDARLALQAAVSRLPKRQREVITLRFCGDLTEADIATTLGCSPSAVRTHLSRAIDSLRAHLLTVPELPTSDTPPTAPGRAGADAARTVARARSVRRKVTTATISAILAIVTGLGAFTANIVDINPDDANDRQSTTTTTTAPTTTTSVPTSQTVIGPNGQPIPAPAGAQPATNPANPTPVPTPNQPTNTPTDTSSCVDLADPACRPNEQTTGVPAGTTLRTVGSLTITQPGTRIDALDIRGCVTVNAPNVIITRTRITGTCTTVLENLSTNLTIEDTEINGIDPNRTDGCIAWSNYTARRIRATNCGTLAKVGDDTTITGALLRLERCDPRWSVISSDQARRLTLRGNTIAATCADIDSAIHLSTRNGPFEAVVIDGNYLNGGGWMVYGGYGARINTPRSVKITNNVFGPLRRYGAITDVGPADVVTGNTGL